ncbi:MAG: two-component system, cell cycle response regulator [Actinomycetota bacterium]|nr:two-component system, cell cycle response regulator [Actinomycetota bacterium]
MSEAGRDGLRVLVVEDNVAHARFVRSILEDLDLELEAHQAGRLTSACERLASEHFDVVLADLHLPDAQGPTVVQRLLEIAPLVPVIVVTALDDEAVASAALAAGAHDFLAKDRLTVELLGHSLRRAAQRAAGMGALRQSALLEPQTGLYNRQGLEVATARCLAFARRQRHPVTIIHLRVVGGTVDDFLGLAGLVRQTVRDADLVGRLANDCLGVVLPDDRSDPPAFLGRLAARRDVGPLVGLNVEVEVSRFDPLAPLPAEELLRVPERAEERPAARRRALVVTSEAGLRDDVTAALGGDWSILHAAGSAPALRMAALEEPHVAVVDLALPDGEGLALARRIGEQVETAHVPVVAVGPGDTADAQVVARMGGLSGFVDRRLVRADLLDAVMRALR